MRETNQIGEIRVWLGRFFKQQHHFADFLYHHSLAGLDLTVDHGGACLTIFTLNFDFDQFMVV